MSQSKEYPSDRAEKFVVRFPDGMRDRIREAAEKNNRSMNAEIIQALQSHYRAVEKEEWENSPEYWEGLHQAHQEGPPEGLIVKSIQQIMAENEARDQAELIAKKVAENLVNNSDFLKTLKKALRPR